MKLSTKAIVGVVAVPVLLLGASIVHVELVVIPREVRAMVHRTRTLARSLQAVAARSGPDASQALAESLVASEPNLAYLIVVDRDGVARVHSEPSRIGMRFPDAGTLAAARDGREIEQIYVRDEADPDSPHHGERTVDILVPLRDPAGRPAGAANVGLSLARVEDFKIRSRLSLLALAALLGLLSWYLIRRIFREVVEPLGSLAEAARQVERGDFAIDLGIERADEIGALASDFGSMSREIRTLVSRLRERESELQRSVDALRRSEARYRTLAEAASDLIFIVRGDRVMLYANRAVAARLGRRVDELLDRPVDELGISYAFAPLEPLFAGALAEGGPVRAEGRVPRTLGPGTVWYDTIAVRLSEGDGVPSVLFVARDVTERKEMEARLLAADRMVSVGTLAAGVAHEINNPLSYVMANLHLLHEDFVSGGGEVLPPDRRDEVRQMLEEAIEGAGRVRSIVRDLKTFSRADEDERGAVDVHTVLDTAIRMAGNQVRHRARLVKCYGELPVVHANEAKLGQVFVNLIVNAIQAIPVGRADENEIRVSTWSEGGRVVVEVADTGQGIAEDQLPLIFQPFYTTKPLGEGTGLGLSICQGIVDSLGGEIRVESRVGEGTSFRVFLPAATETEAPPPTPVVPPSGRRGRILVVDDEPAVCRAIATALARHEVTPLTEGREALRRIESGERFDLVLCDLMMPELTGPELYEAIRATAPEQAERMVFLTGGAFGAGIASFLERVPNPRLEKPFCVDGLRNAVGRMLERVA